MEQKLQKNQKINNTNKNKKFLLVSVNKVNKTIKCRSVTGFAH